MIKLIKSRQSYFIAFVVVAAIALWVFSGAPLETPPEDDYVPFENGLTSSAEIPVRYAEINAQSFQPVIQVAGKSEPDRRVDILAETNGRVTSILHKKGALIKKGDIILQLDMRERKKELAYAKALLKQRQLEYNVSEKLLQRDFSTETRLAEAEAALVAAKFQLANIELDIANTSIKAPFDGVLDDIPTEVGDFISTGRQVARLISMNPIIFTGNVTEKEIPYISKGNKGVAKLISGQKVEGKIRYIAAESDPRTRTFKIEIEAANPDFSIPAGITSELYITAAPITAHKLTPSILVIDAEGHVGVKTLDPENRVTFTPVEIIFSSARDTWVRGLPQSTRIITVGQGYAKTGETITPVADKAFSTTQSEQQ